MRYTRIMLAIALSGITALSVAQTATKPTFDVASIKPSTLIADENIESIDALPGGRLTMTNVSVDSVLEWAYGVQDSQISGRDRLASERYDIVALASAPSTVNDLKLMMRTLLADRFKLVLHRENREQSRYVLVVSKNGPKFRQSEGEGKSDIKRTQTGVIAEKISMLEFANILSGQLRSPVSDMTGLNRRYDLAFDLRQYVANETKPAAISSLILEAMEEQLGLKLESARGPVEVLVVDSVQRPSEN